MSRKTGRAVCVAGILALVLALSASVCGASGVVRWTANGVAVRSGVSSNATFPTMISDGSGGAIVTWEDHRSGYWDIYAQRVNSSGAAQWTANGVALRSIAGSNVQSPSITSDGSGGAIVTWPDHRSGNYDIYAQRVNSAGAPQWTANGVALRSIAGSDVQAPTITSDGSGGAIVTWYDTRSSYNIYAQRVNSSGAAQWTLNGVALRSIAGSNAYDPTITSDGSGGAIVTWYEYRLSGEGDIYAQRVNSAGAAQWTANGVALRSIAGSYANNPTITSDGSGGAIVTWYDNRSGHNDIYAQRVNSAGAAQWTANGVALRSGAGSDATMPTITSDGSGGAIVTWVDARSGVNDIYAQRVATTYSITVSQSAHGTITPAGTAGVVTVNEGTNQAFNIKPDANYHVADVKVDGSSVGALTSYTFHDVTANHTITATFASDSSTWYLAEGTTAWGFDCYITIENPNPSAVRARVTYMPTGAANKTETITMPANSQTTLTNDHLVSVMGQQKDFSTRVECLDATKPIAVDRTMSWGTSENPGDAHSSIGVTSPAKAWYLPEGSSAWGFECWLLIQNPGPSTATCQVTYMIEGQAPRTFTKSVPANSRATFNMATDIGSHDASIKVTSNVPVIPERAMYRNNRGEGHDSIGTTTPASDYYLAEGATGYNAGYTTYVLVQNPQDTPNNVSLTYMTQSGQVAGPSFTMGANSRKTVKVNDILPPDTDVSTRVHGTKPIIAERAMYWDSPGGEKCHDSIGMDSPHTTFWLPDGDATNEYVETYTLAQNPNSTPVKVRVTYLTPSGTGNVTFTDTIPANSRHTYKMNDKIPGTRAAIVVKSITSGKKIMVERAMYFGDGRRAGTDTIGGYED